MALAMAGRFMIRIITLTSFTVWYLPIHTANLNTLQALLIGGFQAYQPTYILALATPCFLTTRTDLLHYTPIPMILPITSVGYNKVSVNTTSIPGTKGNGNVFFFWSKVAL